MIKYIIVYILIIILLIVIMCVLCKAIKEINIIKEELKMNLYNITLEDGRIEYYKVTTETKENGNIVRNIYNFIDIKKLAGFINQFLESNDIFVSEDSILEELETTDTYRFLVKQFKIDCSLCFMNFEG